MEYKLIDSNGRDYVINDIKKFANIFLNIILMVFQYMKKKDIILK